LKTKLLSGKRLTTALDNAVRKLIRLEYPNPVCFVCGKNGGWFDPKTNPKGCQTGHYISRRRFAVRWDMDNIFVQCSSCNKVHNQNPAPFTLAIIKTYGEDRIDKLNKICNDYTSYSTLEKRKILETLRERINEKKAL